MAKFMDFVEEARKETLSVNHDSDVGMLSFFEAILGMKLSNVGIGKLAPVMVSNFCKFFELKR